MAVNNIDRAGERPVTGDRNHMLQKPDSFGCVGTTIKMFNGEYLDLLDPRPDLIDLHSIAVSLGRQCRYGNQCPQFYSVAEHSAHCLKLAVKYGCEYPAEVLMHDAAEAFIGDVVKPLKMLLPEYQVIEQRMEEAIAERFHLKCHLAIDDVKRYDRALLQAEKMQMWPEDAVLWEGFTEQSLEIVELEYLTSEDATDWFLELAEQYLPDEVLS